MDNSSISFLDLFSNEALNCVAAAFADATKNGVRISISDFMSQMKFDANLPVERERMRRGENGKSAQRSDQELSKFLLDRREEVILALVSEGYLDNRIDGACFAHYRGADGGIGRADQSSDKKKASNKRRITTEFIVKLTSILDEKCANGAFIKRAEVAELLGATATTVSAYMLDIAEVLVSDPYLCSTYGTYKSPSGGIGLKSVIEAKLAEKSA